MARISSACRSVYITSPFSLRLDGDQVFAAVERHLADADLAGHALADDGERVGGDLRVGREVVGPLEVDRVELVALGELQRGR